MGSQVLRYAHMSLHKDKKYDHTYDQREGALWNSGCMEELGALGRTSSYSDMHIFLRHKMI